VSPSAPKGQLRQPDQQRLADSDGTNRIARALVIVVVLVGLVVTAGAARAFAGRSDQQRQLALDEGATLIADAASGRLSEAVTASQRLMLTTVATWGSPADFQSELVRRSSALPGESAAVVVLAVTSKDLVSFESAEREANPDFAISLLPDRPDQPEPTNHLIVMRSTMNPETEGLELSTESSLGGALWDLRPGGLHMLQESSATDRFGPADSLQLVSRSRASGPDNNRYDSWVIVRLDIVALLQQAPRAGGAGFGAQFVADSTLDLGAFGLVRPESTRSVNERRPVGPFVLETEVWSDGSTSQSVSSLRVIVLGLAGTAGTALVVYLLAALIANQRRASVQASQAREDHLTGVPNRRWVMEHMASLHGHPVAVLFCDLDRFKVVNDSMGHGAGDSILIQVVKRLGLVLDKHSALARFGGDEFLVVCSGIPDIKRHANEVAAQINGVMAEPFQLGSNEFATTMSIGVACAEADENVSGEELIRRADVALGLCKQRGRNGAVLYDKRLRDGEVDRLAFEQDLRSALDSGDLTVHYQPIVDGQRRIVSYEALVRWNRRGELIPPAVFLPVVEEIGRMNDLGEIVLDKAIAEFSVGVDPKSLTSLHVNIEARQLVDAEFPRLVRSLLERHQLAARRLILELTEGELVHAMEEIMPGLDELTSFGVGFTIDDFGAGYSNIGRALSVKGLAEIKLDRSLVQGLSEARNRDFMRGFAGTLLGMGISTIAEGVETEEDMRNVAQTGVHLFQGWLFAADAAAEDLDFSLAKIPKTAAHTDSTASQQAVGEAFPNMAGRDS